MAVELRCPDCRAKLKLKAAPEPGSEVECPECYAVFEAPDDAARADDDRPRKRKPAADDGDDDRPRKKKEKKPKEKPAKAGADPKAPKKRRAKKKETNKALLFALIGGGLAFLGLVIFMLTWFFLKKPAAYELMAYLPPDCSSVQGANLGHVRRYTEFYKKFESQVNEAPFKRAADAAAKAVGADPVDFIDYMATGTTPKGESAVVIKAKQPFDGSLLSKMPGARQGNADGRTYYTVSEIPGAFSGPVRVFSPSPKLVVFCPERGTSPGTFNKIISGNAGDPEGTIQGRHPALAKRTVRGTAWSLIVLDANNRPKEPEKSKEGGGSSGGEYEALVAGNSKSAKAFGFKASVGSRHVRFEVALQFADSEGAQSLRQKFRDSPLAKTDDASLDPPKYWKQFETSVVGNKKVGTELYSTLGATTSGDLFVIYAESETNTLMENGVSTIVGKMTGAGSGGGAPGMPGGAGGQPPAGGGPPPQPGGRVGGAQGGVAF